MLMKHTYLT